MLQRVLRVVLAIVILFGVFATSRAVVTASPVKHLAPQPLTTFPTLVTVLQPANVRAGPGTDFPIISAAWPGQRLSVLACNLDCSWYLLAEDCWIAAFLVKPDQPVAGTTPLTPGLPITTVVPGGALPTVMVGVPITVSGVPPAQAIRCPQPAAETTTYAGPATSYAVVDTRPAGECLAVVGRNTAGDWFQVAHGAWIEAAAVLYADPIEFIPVTDQVFTPTPTTIATPVPPFTLTAEEQAYLDFLALQVATYTNAWATLESQMALVEATPTLLQTSDWNGQTGAAIKIIRLTGEAIRVRFPPPRLTPVHAEYLAAADYYDESMDFLEQAIAAQDLSLFERARRCAAAANDAIGRADAVLESIRQGGVIAPVATATPVFTPTLAPTTLTPAATAPAAAAGEIMTVGEWVTAAQPQKDATATLWTQRLAATGQVTGDAALYAAALVTCIDNTLSSTSDLLGAAYPIQPIVDGCVAVLD